MKGVFFDLFGTLLIYTNSRQAWEDWLTVLYFNFKNYGYKETRESFAMECNGFMGKSEPNHKSLNLTIFEQRIYNLSNALELKINHEEIQRIAYEAVNAWQKYVPLDPVAIPVLNILKKNKILAIVSNFDHPPHIYALLSKLNLKDFFDSVIISSEVGVKKPDPSIFSYAFKQTNLDPSEICYIGDTKNDINAAINAEILPVLIRRKTNAEDEILYDYRTKKTLNNKKVFEKIPKNVKIIENLKEIIQIV